MDWIDSTMLHCWADILMSCLMWLHLLVIAHMPWILHQTLHSTYAYSKTHKACLPYWTVIWSQSWPWPFWWRSWQAPGSMKMQWSTSDNWRSAPYRWESSSRASWCTSWWWYRWNYSQRIWAFELKDRRQRRCQALWGCSEWTHSSDVWFHRADLGAMVYPMHHWAIFWRNPMLLDWMRMIEGPPWKLRQHPSSFVRWFGILDQIGLDLNNSETRSHVIGFVRRKPWFQAYSQTSWCNRLKMTMLWLYQSNVSEHRHIS